MRAADAGRSTALTIDMKLRIISVAIVLATVVGSAWGDSNIAFETKRFYSPDRHYFVEVRTDKRATLYRNGRRLRRIWTRTLPELPRDLIVANAGNGIAMVDFYYGNNCKPNAPVVTLFGRAGKQLSRYLLKDVADLSRTPATTSMCYWYGDAKLAPDNQSLIVQTTVAKHDRSKCGNINSPHEAEKMWEICMATTPYQNLVFDLANGSLISRTNIAAR